LTDCKILLHPAILARRAAEIARSQNGSTAGLRNPARLEQDARGRPFIRGADLLAKAADPPVAPPGPGERGRFAWLIRVIRALKREAGPPVGEVRKT
jgi:hypothetical protein